MLASMHRRAGKITGASRVGTDLGLLNHEVPRSAQGCPLPNADISPPEYV